MHFSTVPLIHDITDGCGSSNCGCVREAASQSTEPVHMLPFINGVALQYEGETCDPNTLRERAYAELLRQEAIRHGLLPPVPVTLAPALTENDQHAIDGMLDTQVTVPTPSVQECQRYYDAHRQMLAVGQSRQIRHILFAVTQGVNVTALAQKAESTLFELRKPDVAVERFEQLASELSNCPTGAQGGELGWLTPQDCAPELAKELFFNQESSETLGIMPRLVQTRHGFHIIDVQAFTLGKLPEFDVIHPQLRLRLQAQSKVTALRQYMTLLVGRSEVQGLYLEGSASDLVQ
jgi:peptidyl-prolyl cis-trans isomerase C